MSAWLLATETLLFLQGVFSQFFQAEAARELAVRSGGVELCYAAAIVATMFWTASGCFAATLSNKIRKSGSNAWACVLCALSPVAALLSYAFAAGAQPIPGVDDSLRFGLEEMALYCGVAPLLFGVVNGALFGMVCGLVPRESGDRLYFSDALGMTLGGVVFSALLSQFSMPMSILSIPGAFLPFTGFAIFGRKIVSTLGKATCGLLCAICLGSVGILGLSDSMIASMKWERLLPGFSFEGSVDTASGRVEFLKNLKSPSGELAIYRDGELETLLPKDREPEFPAALFAVAQPGHGNLSVMLICSPFSLLPDILASLPVVEHVDMFVQDERLAQLSRKFGILPEESERFHVIEGEPRRRLESEKCAYDLVMLLDSSPCTLESNRFFTAEFYKTVSSHLKPGGVYVAGMANSPYYSDAVLLEFNGILDATLKTVFKNVVFTPVSLRLLAAGDGPNVSSDFDELDLRNASSMPEAKSFPQGLLGIVFSQARQREESLKISQASISSSLNTDLSPMLPWLHIRRNIQMAGWGVDAMEWAYFLWKEIFVGLLLVYVFARYFMSWKMSRKMSFLSFENGFYAAGLTVLMLFMYQMRCGNLYRDLAAACGLFLFGAAFGALLGLRAPLLSKIFRWLSPFMPLAAAAMPFLPWLPALLCGGFGLFLGGCSVGSCYAEFNDEADSKESPGLIWSAELFGGVLGMAALSFFLLPAGGFIACVLLLCVVRLPYLLWTK